ncbi:MAG: peptide chain release factor N(5)-glutamine methyltransferase [Chloracidobacterium sp.]|nr:peptide chain release factor N(5)-glutamine methyltransferase [Chloracidobacterium sp.]MDW8218200.1 peptide chain release factor N(5)-glutamine methyltransferase [Acidobacteriota bacterium]
MSTTLGELVKEGARILASNAVAEPYRTALHLVRAVLKIDAATLLAHPERTVAAGDAARVQQAFVRRANGEPLQYITETQDFYGRDFYVTPAVLIPRPETELLVEAVINHCRAQAKTTLHLLDLGTGSGCLAVTLAAMLPTAQVIAVDISPSALAVAEANARRHGVAERIVFLESDWLSALPADAPLFDAVVANPPYIAEAELSGLQREVRDYEPHVALIAGPDGTEAYVRLFADLPRHLADGGFFACEVGFGQADKVCALGAGHGWRLQQTLHDLQGIPRTLVFTHAADVADNPSRRACSP